MVKRIDAVHYKNLVIAIIIILQILFFIVCLIVISSRMSIHDDNHRVKEQKTERYRSVRICSGESLWEISKRYYSDEYKSVNLYIKKIMRLNNMSDEDITSGAYLIIPYYE